MIQIKTPNPSQPIQPFPAAGSLMIPMTNDYLFRALLQKNNRVLKGLICSLLRLPFDQVHTVQIVNPIELGASITDKTFILDIKVCLNNLTVINLELQVINEHNWVDRSLSYLCRNFDTLTKGEDYENVRPTIQIGLLNFTLFPEHPEFYATYQLLNVKNYSLYSDKLRISVLDLTQVELADKEDMSCQLDCWARFFKAATWEEINMLAQENENLKEAATTVYQLTQKERIRMECEAREDYYRTQLGWQKRLKKQADTIESLSTEVKSLTAEIERLRRQLESPTQES